MSYACIDREELARRGLCEPGTCEPPPPTIIRETLLEPILPSVEPLFASDPFVPVSWGSGRSGGSRFGGGRRGGSRRLGGGIVRQPGTRTVAGGGDGGGIVRQPGTNYVATAPSTGAQLVAKPAEYRASATYSTPARAVVSRGREYTASQPYARATRSVVARNTYTAAPPRAAAPTMGVKTSYSVAPTTYTKSLKGLGQVAGSVSPYWKWAALGLVGLVGVQFWWWNKKAPQVLKLGKPGKLGRWY
jgi:hypothetical protein